MSLCDHRDGLLENEEMVILHWSRKDILPSAFSQLSPAIPSVRLKFKPTNQKTTQSKKCHWHLRFVIGCAKHGKLHEHV